MSKIAISHAVVLVAERRWRTMRETRTSVIATPAIIDKCEAITELSIRFAKPDLEVMEFRQLGRSGLKVSVLSLGTMTFGGKGAFGKTGSTDVEGARRQIDLCIDTAAAQRSSRRNSA